MRDLLTWIDRLGCPRILVLGDVILDRYTWGDAERVSPEAPVLVLRADLHEARLGGAGSVARLLRELGADVCLAGVLGDDANGRIVTKLLDDEGICREALLCDSSRPTTSKDRFIGRAANRHPHQILRVDSEVRKPLDADIEALLLDGILAELGGVQAVLVSDYGKGTCTPRILQAVIERASAQAIPLIIDPGRNADYSHYAGVTLLTPNRIEAEVAAGQQIETPADALIAGRCLCDKLAVGAVVVTLDKDGMALVTRDGSCNLYPTRPRMVYDITGAGDMVLAMLGVCMAAGVPLSEAVRLANIAAGLEIAKFGVSPVSREEIRTEIAQTGAAESSKLVTFDEMVALAASYREAGRRVVFTNGCFDLLHIGHITYLQEASRLGDVLVVAVNSDRSVRKLKGKTRPLIGEQERAAMVAALGCVDHVLVFDDDTPHRLLSGIWPDVLVKGGTYAVEQVVGREIVEAYGGRVCTTSQVDGVSTTRILSSIARQSLAETASGASLQK